VHLKLDGSLEKELILEEDEKLSCSKTIYEVFGNENDSMKHKWSLFSNNSDKK